MSSSLVERDTFEVDDLMGDMLMLIMMVVMVSVMTSVASAVQGAATQGVTDYYHLDATSTVQEVTFSEPMRSLSVGNLGSVVLWVKTNTLNSKAVPVGQGQEVTIDAGTGTISRMFYYTVSGVTQGEVHGIY